MQRHTYVVLALVAVLLLAGCGGDSTPTATETPTGTPTATAASTATPTATPVPEADVNVTWDTCEQVTVTGESFSSVILQAADTSLTYDDGFNGSETFTVGANITQAVVYTEDAQKSVDSPAHCVPSDTEATPTPEPTATPTDAPTATPTTTPTATPTPEPTPTATPEPGSLMSAEGDSMDSTDEEVYVSGTFRNEHEYAEYGSVRVQFYDDSGTEIGTASQGFNLDANSGQQFTITYDGEGWENATDYEIEVTA